MVRRLGFVPALALSVAVLGLPAAAFAQAVQASITGVVRDTSGAVMPGVSVEVSSDALIEKVRTTVSDSEGLYRITDLRPGTYVVTFALTVFNTVRREALELTPGFVATINPEMRVGTLEETVTVSGQSPIVDVQSTVQQRVMSRDTLDSLPTGEDNPGVRYADAGNHHPGFGAGRGRQPGRAGHRGWASTAIVRPT